MPSTYPTAKKSLLCGNSSTRPPLASLFAGLFLYVFIRFYTLLSKSCKRCRARAVEVLLLLFRHLYRHTHTPLFVERNHPPRVPLLYKTYKSPVALAGRGFAGLYTLYKSV